MGQSLIYAETMPPGGKLSLAALSVRDAQADVRWRAEVASFRVVELHTLARENPVQMAVGHELGDLAHDDWRAEVAANAARVDALIAATAEVMAALDADGVTPIDCYTVAGSAASSGAC